MNYNQLSDEQQDFVDHALIGENILVEACIGSGKTTAIQFLCNQYPDDIKVLYLTYNKLLKLDAQSKIKCKNVMVQNYHGLAYHYLNKVHISSGITELITKFNKIKPPVDRFDVLIIDEYQDIETEFGELLSIVKSANPSMQIIAVGDMKQKIYDKTNLNVYEFINSFLGDHARLEFTKCFRLSKDIAARLGRIWNKNIIGVNKYCTVEEMTEANVVSFLATQDPKDILCLGARYGSLSDTLNKLESRYPRIFNKRTVYASISENGSFGNTNPTPSTAIFTTFDSSKGMERKTCVVFDYTEDYWETRISKPQQSFDILRNIFCVAASRGKERIIFVRNGGEPLSEATLSTKTDSNMKMDDVDISTMFDFKYMEDINSCYSLLDITPIDCNDTSVIDVKGKDGLIDLSPCIGVYQEAFYFNNYDINKQIEMCLSFNPERMFLWNKKTKSLDLDRKILFLTSIQTNQDRYMKQVKVPFISDEAKKQIRDRLSTRLSQDELTQVGCDISFASKENGCVEFTARGITDAIKKDVVYELKFVSVLSRQHFLQCACYVVALGLEKGILWNVRDNTSYEIRVPDKKKFLDAVVNAVTKNKITEYFEPSYISDQA